MRLMDKLKRPFPVNQLKWRKGPQGKELVYIDARQYQQRLDEIMGTDWQCKYSHVTQGGVVCEVGLKIDGEWLWRSDGAGETQIEGDKGQFTDAFKRACVKWGIGKYLYELKDGRNIPNWATPEGYDEIIARKGFAYSQDQREKLLQLIETEDLYAFYTFWHSLDANEAAALMKSFPTGQKTEMKKKIEQLVGDSREAMLDLSVSLSTYMDEGDEQGAKEILDSISGPLREHVINNLPPHNQQEAEEAA